MLHSNTTSVAAREGQLSDYAQIWYLVVLVILQNNAQIKTYNMHVATFAYFD